MREKYESLSVAVLRDLAKTRGISGTSAMKKSQLVDAMLAQDEIDAATKEATVTAETKSREDKRETTRGENGTERNTAQRGQDGGDGCGSTAAGRAQGMWRYPGGDVGRIWIYPKRQLSAGRQRCLCFTIPDS